MPIAAKEPIASVEAEALCGIADGQLAESISREIRRRQPAASVSVAENLSQLVGGLVHSRPRVVLLDDDLVAGAPLAEFLRQLNESAPVVLIGSFDREKEIAGLVEDGKVEFVGRLGDFAPLAASLVLRHLRGAELARLGAVASRGVMSDDIAEIFRHDINNPLTGILGNAELVLSHAVKLPPADIQRLQTVVELAVRLRETIRQLSDAWEGQSQALRST
jgi:signal transduction histidine kinase